MPEFKYVVCKKDNVREIDTKIKNKIGESDKKLANQSVFLFTENKVVTRGKFKIIPDTTFEDLYSKHKNFKDGVLYLYFANVDSFWSQLSSILQVADNNKYLSEEINTRMLIWLQLNSILQVANHNKNYQKGLTLEYWR